uniref:Bestrophin homolog n=1 Tax=Ascaris lumbricoides TaxID=6252 RepID=A0A0M3HSZ0_ASCLU
MVVYSAIVRAHHTSDTPSLSESLDKSAIPTLAILLLSLMVTYFEEIWQQRHCYGLWKMPLHPLIVLNGFHIKQRQIVNLLEVSGISSSIIA